MHIQVTCLLKFSVYNSTQDCCAAICLHRLSNRLIPSLDKVIIDTDCVVLHEASVNAIFCNHYYASMPFYRTTT